MTSDTPELLAALKERTAACETLRQQVTMYYLAIGGDTARQFERMVFPALEGAAGRGYGTALVVIAEAEARAPGPLEAELPRPISPEKP